jgi:hypothetical protein
VAAARPGQIVDVRPSGSNLVVGLAVVERFEISRREADVNETRERGVVKGSAIHPELELIEQVGPEEVLQGYEVVCGVIVGVVLVEEIPVGGPSEGDVALGAGIECRGLGEFVIEAS